MSRLFFLFQPQNGSGGNVKGGKIGFFHGDPAGTEHLGKFRPYGPKYYNLGVAMLNLREIRESGIDKQLAELLNKEELPYIDQDAWNKLGMERSAELPARYNECFATGRTEHPAIFHYAGILHWHHEPLVERYRSMPWSEIRGGLCVT